MGIVSVFCAGLFKLWWNNRLMKKKEILDEEKRARVEEMRKTGLPMKRANTVPFGIRALQSGVEVDGIWTAVPTELGEKLASSATLTGGHDSDSRGKGVDYSEDDRSVRVKTKGPGSRLNPSNASGFLKPADTESIASNNSALPGPQAASSQSAHGGRSKRQPSRTTGNLNEDTLRRLEGQSPSPMNRHYDGYIPAATTTTAASTPPASTSAPTSFRFHYPHRASGRNSAASSTADSIDSHQRSYTSSNSAAKPHYHMAGARSASGGRDPFGTPARTPSGFSMLSSLGGGGGGEVLYSLHHQPQQGHGSAADPARQEMATPEPTFGPGELHYGAAGRNGSSRRVVASESGYDLVLPPGVIGGSRSRGSGGSSTSR
ncbi:hypothetical protein B0J18DRAFT_423702 [Chaetomium sp. MPI-SDFR-AT-0129]|nr:hypothetical protein B0J18DRAFT_423702 [Chaetomium sp. MPI-SDFR-AT-0129]